MSSTKELDQVNDDTAVTLLPAIILVVIYMLIGLFGNPLVAFYYGCRAKATSSYHFIVALSVFDLITCCISMPLEIVDMRNSFKFENTIACKILRFVNYFASISSGGILIAIAVDRYRKICHPFKKQITLKLTKNIIVITCMFSTCVSWPSFVFYGAHEVNVTSVPGVVGYDCTTTRDNSFKIYITIYNIILFIFFFVAITSIIVLYCLVGNRLINLKQFQFYAAKPKSSNANTASHDSSDFKTSIAILSQRTSNVIEIPDETDDKPLATIKELDSSSRPSSATSSRPVSSKSVNRVHPQNIQNDVQKFTEGGSIASPSKGVSSISIHISNEVRKGSAMSNHSGRSRSTRQGSSASGTSRISGLSEYSDSNYVPASSEARDARGSIDIDKNDKKLHAQNVDTKKYTIIMLSISIAFILSFLPYLGLVTWRTLAKEHEFHLFSDAAYCAYQIFIRSFLISSAVNPLIYGFLNTEFRNFVKTICQKCCCCCCYKKKQTKQKQEHSASFSK